jgi:ABC-type Fe3+/spermidine/putrescine transport system ATPase subunit
VKKLDLTESKQIARELFVLLNISGKEKNYPNEISGGQKQRVALARAILSNAKLLVMDDPLRALDAKIREILQVELRKLVKDLGLTCIHATHDTHEAMRVADRIAVFKDGKIAQIGSPEEVYNNPNSLFVADFLGESTTIQGKIKKKKAESLFISDDGLELKVITDLKNGAEAIALVPSELLDVFDVKEKENLNYDNIVEGTIQHSKCIGEFNEIEIQIGDITFKAKDLIGKPIPLKPGSKVLIATDKDDYRIFPKEEEKENEE